MLVIAGSSLAAAAAKESEMESRSSERRKAPHLPAPTAATVQSAREKANSVITNTLNRIAGNRHADDAQQGHENEYKMEVGNSPPPPGQRSGSGTTSGSCGGGGTAALDPGKVTKSGKAKKKSNNTVDPAAAGTSQPVQDVEVLNGGAANGGQAGEPERVYKNLRRPSGDRDPDMRKTAKYDEIMIQRKIRGEHEAVNSGPGVEGFDCGSFFMAGDNRSLYANMEESTNDLLVSSTSFNRFNWECTSCETRHDLLPLRHTRGTTGRGAESSSSYQTKTCRRCCPPRRECVRRCCGSTAAISGSWALIFSPSWGDMLYQRAV
jgi:hypothetical protein